MTTLQDSAPSTPAAAAATATPSNTRSTELPLRDRICLTAVEHFGRFGFDESMLEMSIANDVDVQTLTELFGSIEGLRTACDQYVQSSITAAKAETLSSHDPARWFAQLAHIDSFAPMMAYLVRSLQSGDDFGHTLMRQMIDNATNYLEAAVRAGTIKPSRDPAARARFLAMSGGGGFLLYLQMHSTPDDMSAVLRDYARDMIMPALELYTQGLMADDTMYEAFLARAEHGRPPQP